jgi:hypothetical protein
MSGGGVDGAPVAEFRQTVTHGGRFLQYNIFGNLFEITHKYQPPIMPIGRGAYGIVWYVLANCRLSAAWAAVWLIFLANCSRWLPGVRVFFLLAIRS